MKCFIGLPAAKEAVPHLCELQKRAFSLDPASRIIPAENFHVTLAFYRRDHIRAGSARRSGRGHHDGFQLKELEHYPKRPVCSSESLLRQRRAL